MEDRVLVWEKQKRAGWSYRRIASLEGVSESTIRRRLKRRAAATPSTSFSSLASEVTLDTPLTHVGEAIITADWHFPLFDPSVGDKMLDVADATKIKSLVIAGDYFNMDALSRFYPKQEGAELWEEIKVAQNCMKLLLRKFDVVYLIRGNHDERLLRSLGWTISFAQSMLLLFGELGEDLLRKLRISNYDHMWIRPYVRAPDPVSWYLCHPSSYTQVPLSRARVISEKTNSNVITAHSHHFAMGWSKDGKKIVAEIGGLFDTEKTEYIKNSTTYPNWVNGFMWLQYDDREVDSPFRVLGLRSCPSLWIPR